MRESKVSMFATHIFLPSVHHALARNRRIRSSTYAALCPSGILDSILLISPGPKPVAVRLCFGLLKPGPTGPWRSEMGALVESFRSRILVPLVAMLRNKEGWGH